MKCNDCETKQSWHYSKNYIGIYLKGVRKTQKYLPIYFVSELGVLNLEFVFILRQFK